MPTVKVFAEKWRVHSKAQAVGTNFLFDGKEIYLDADARGVLFVSRASTAESLRSMCGSVRGAPECNKQRSPTAAPHVVQGTANSCFAVRSRILIEIGWDKRSRKTVPFWT